MSGMPEEIKELIRKDPEEAIKRLDLLFSELQQIVPTIESLEKTLKKIHQN